MASIRAELGLSRAAFAQALGVKPSRIQYIERHRHGPCLEFLAAMCDAYNVNPDYLSKGQLPMLLCMDKALKADQIPNSGVIDELRKVAILPSEIAAARKVTARYDEACRQVDELLRDILVSPGPLLLEALRMLAMDGVKPDRLLLVARGIQAEIGAGRTTGSR